MALGSTLLRTLTLTKREVGASLSSGAVDNASLLQAIEVAQEELAASHDWAELKDMWDKALAGGAGSRWTAFPTAGVGGSTQGINFDRDIEAWVFHNSVWQPLCKGITLEEYNVKDSDAGEMQDPPQRWDFKQGSRASFEVWPIPTTAHTVRFIGQRKLATLRTSGSLDTALFLDLDDVLVALQVALDWIKNPKEKTVKAARFQERFNRLRANNVRNDDPIIIGGRKKRDQKLVPIAVA